MIDVAEFEEQLGPAIETRADAVEHGGKMLAKAGMIRAGATEFNFLGLGKKPIVLVGDDSHDFIGDFSLEQFDKRANFPLGVGLQGFPSGGG